MKDEELNDVNIQHFKLINGDELIALVRGSEGSRILLEFPLMLNVMPMGSGKESFYFTEWMPMTKDEVIQVYATSIISHSECTDEFKEHYINKPYGDVWKHLRALAYQQHPYQWMTIGKELAHIEEAQLEDVKAFFKKHYNPQNAVVCVAGNCSFEEVVALAKKWFEPIPAGEKYIRNIAPEPAQNLLTYYQKAESSTGIEWEVLAAVNLVETGMGRIDGIARACIKDIGYEQENFHHATVEITNLLHEQSAPAQGRWFWSYHIRIENGGDEPVQLMTRHWRITDGRGTINHVDGDGVVGEQPLLKPGESHDYVSGCPLPTPSGMMEGQYRFIREDGTTFLAEIPRFTLVAPAIAR